MGKLNELIKLIEKTHPEWKKLSIRKLRDISGYKKWVCEEYFKKYPKDKVKTIPKTVTSSSKKQQQRGVSTASPQISPILVAMNDNELARHRLRMILTNTATTNKEVLEAVGRFVNYMDKSGTINIETESEKEVMDKFRSQSVQQLVNMLKESSQKEA